MGYKATQIQLSYEFAKVLPTNDPAYIEYEQFTKIFGEDGNVMVIGIQDQNLFKFENWWYSYVLQFWYTQLNKTDKTT